MAACPPLLKFNEAPTGSVPFENDEMVRINEELTAKIMAAGMAGHFYDEHVDKGY